MIDSCITLSKVNFVFGITSKLANNSLETVISWILSYNSYSFKNKLCKASPCYLRGFERYVVFLALGSIDGGKRVLRTSRYDLLMRAVNEKRPKKKKKTFDRLNVSYNHSGCFELGDNNNE